MTGALVAASPAAAFQPLSQLGTGTAGPAAGQLDEPYQVAIDADGNTFVGDSNNRRISEFAPNGSFIKAFGTDVGGPGVNVCTATCQIGTDDGSAGSLSFPDGLAIDPVSGDLVIGDEADDRVDVFTPAGGFVRAFGKDVGGSGVNVCTTTCQLPATSSGSGSGQFNTPVEIAIDGGGNVFVGDLINNRIDVLTLTGGFQRAFGGDVGGAGVNTCTTGCLQGTPGGDAGHLDDSSGVALDPAGNLYVAESGGDRISVFTTGGTFERAFGADVGGAGVNVCTTVCSSATTGVGPGQLDNPYQVGFNPLTGEVLVPEFNNNRVSVFRPDGTFLRAFGEDVTPGGVSGFETCTTSCKQGTATGAPGALDSPGAITVDCAGTLYVSEDTALGRVELLGEPGALAPPCKPAATATKPSNAFSFGKVKRNIRKGTARLSVIVPGAGTLVLGGKGLVSQRPAAAASKAVGAAGTVKLLVKTKGKQRKKLNKRGKLKVKPKVTFTPTGGDPNSQTKSITLKKKLR